MATSGVITGTLTVREVVSTALELMGALSIGETPPAEEAALGLKHLNWMLKSWQADGLTNGWRVQEINWTHTAATATVTLDTNYLDVMDARRRVSSVDTPLQRLSIQEYAEISNKTLAGTPTCYMVRKTVASLAVTLWPVPSSNTTIYADGARVIEDVTALGETLDVPQEWLETVYTCLAARLILPLRKHISDPAGAADIKERAAGLYGRLKTFDDEGGSVMFSAA
jgi:hypothetical protein